MKIKEEKFIIGIREHPSFGYIAVPLIVGDCNDEYCKIIRSVVFQDIIDSPDEYNDEQKEIVSIIDNYSDEKIFSLFNNNKKLSITDFLSTIDQNFIEDNIRPYIEKHLYHLFKLLKNSNVELFYKLYRYDHIYYSDKIYLNKTSAKAVFNFERSNEGIKYYLTVSFNDKEIPIYKKKPIIFLNKPALIELEHILLFIENIDAKKLLPFYNKKFVFVPKSMELKYFKNFILKTVTNQTVKAKGFDIKFPKVDKKVKLFVENDWRGEYSLTPKFYYNNISFYIKDKMKNFVEFDEKTFTITKFSRDFKWEQSYIKFFNHLGLVRKDDNYFKINYDAKLKKLQHNATINWLNENCKKIEEKGIEVTQKFITKKYFVKDLDIDFKINKKIDWFDISANVKFGDFEIPFLQLKNYLINNIREFELPNGEIAIIPETWFKKYKNILKFGQKTGKASVKLNKIHYFALLDIEYKQKNIDTKELDKFFKKPKEYTVKPPLNLKTKLRNYQITGYSWLNHLRKNSFGGCLADDMGLGKTVQILAAVLKTLEEKNQITKNPKIFNDQNNKSLNLVIVPRSLLHNWLNEVQKNTPVIKTLLYTGNDREKLQKKIHKADLIITSYGIARNDLDFFMNFCFNYIILDESQYIKNNTSKTYRAIIRLKGKNKVVLTGTPIENSLRDLWTQLNFVNPGILGSFNFFKENYISEIERHNDDEVKKDLKKIIAPFILRRTKEEVDSDLPDIEEQSIICEMSEEQSNFYEEEKSKIRNKIIEYYNNGILKKSSFYVLQALTKLRQIANHPQMIGEKNYTSGKFDEIIERLSILINQNHKVLIFSNFVKYLNLFKQQFEKNNWKYEMLTGETNNRKNIIDNFQKKDEIKLFLISIKAGGVGLNLTAADYVFVLDPWWNPAVEKQAIARAHRIGQTKNVFAFKFITFGTVEEKIQKLQKKKLKLANEFIDANNYFKYFEDDTIVELFN